MSNSIMTQLKAMGAIDEKVLKGMEDTYLSALQEFLTGQDFMRLGHCINGRQWNTAMMNCKRLKENCERLGIHCFDRWIMGVRDAIIRQNHAEALQIMTQITAKRVQLRSILAKEHETCDM